MMGTEEAVVKARTEEKVVKGTKKKGLTGVVEEGMVIVIEGMAVKEATAAGMEIKEDTMGFSEMRARKIASKRGLTDRYFYCRKS